ncbi:MAG: NAD-dependent epimerase/dehydratase family protein [Phycisphaerales bacterium]|nr:NAD-dependent epimerase/dehydratase family protein [Phycisphaerales bacterium]
MRKPVVLITGANGEIGHGLIDHFARAGKTNIVAFDLRPLDAKLQPLVTANVAGDILDAALLQKLADEYEIREIYHLAALLSTRSEHAPELAHRVNVDGTMNLLKLAQDQSRAVQRPVLFLFPSSIAAYGLPSVEAKHQAGRVRESDWTTPTTMYGCNKLYCEQLGRYYSDHYRQLAPEAGACGLDFRAIRFPGLISALTMPSGGTSDYAPEMIHAAAQGKPYACFVPERAQIPFMAMPDGVKAILQLAAAPAARLSQRVYNIAAFSPTAGEIRDRVLAAFPDARITFSIDRPRAAIVDSWPADVDDSAARRDWSWSPDYDADRAFDEYLIPAISEHYRAFAA